MSNAHFITRVQIQNYKSIKACKVQLGPLAILVGPNGSGKSNFVDALRFTAEALSSTLDHALRERGGINEVRRRSGGHPNHFAVRLDFNLPTGATGSYAFKVGALPSGGFHVTDEEAVVHPGPALGEPSRFRIQRGVLETNLAERLPMVAEDRLYLVSASSIEQFRPVYEALTAMGFYNLSPAAIRQPQLPDPGALLRRDGSNLASVLGRLEQADPDMLVRVVDYLRRISRGVEGVSKVPVGPMETIEFRQKVAGQERPWRFAAINMSDGTLRGLGVLVALLQTNGQGPSLVGIEEPEVALHPAAVGILIDAIKDAATHTQLLVTSHSPDLLDRQDLDPSEILAVTSHDGNTIIGPMDQHGRDVLREHLFTAGELLRMNQLEPDLAADGVQGLQLKLFDR
ncbi:MAG: AAA family ATPase [Actinomycetota bacterium]|nr:AAA family ATPase [Actinomycetota bacterium]